MFLCCILNDRQCICPVKKHCTRRRLRSASSSTLVVPLMHHSTIGNRTFPVAASRVWNSLPSSVTSSMSLTAFRRRFKSELFLRCFGQDCVWCIFACARLRMHTFMHTFVKFLAVLWILRHYNLTRFIIIIIIIIIPLFLKLLFQNKNY